MPKTLRDWAEPSYDGKTGRAASSLQEAGTGSKGNHTTNVTAHLDQAKGVGALNKSGSADGGRNKWGGSKLP
jgi:hypothetical protein